MKQCFQRASFFIFCVFFLSSCEKKEAVTAPPPPDVKVAVVLQKDVPIYVENVGETVGSLM